MRYTVEPSYNDIGLYDTSHITSDILWYQSVRHCYPEHYTAGLEQLLFVMKGDMQPFGYDIFVNCNWVDTRWQ